MADSDVLKDMAARLAAKHGVSQDAVVCIMAHAKDYVESRMADRGSSRRLAEIEEPAVAAAVIAAVEGVKLVAGHRIDVYPERILDDRQFAELYEKVRMALRAARAMLPEPPEVCESCKGACTRCGNKPRRC